MPHPKEYIEVWIGLKVGKKYELKGEVVGVNLSDPICVFDYDEKEIWSLSPTAPIPLNLSIKFTATCSILYIGTKNRTKNAQINNYKLIEVNEELEETSPSSKTDDYEYPYTNPFSGRKSYF